MAKITDPDSLTRCTTGQLGTDGNLEIDTTNHTLGLAAYGSLSDSGSSATNGVSLQAVYSKLKELWKSESDLPVEKFPIEALQPDKYEVKNGWTWKDANTRTLLRDGGWAVLDTSEVTQNAEEMFMNVISLGSFDDSANDLAYFQRTDGGDPVDFDFNGEVNQGVQIYQDDNADGTPDNDWRDYFVMFLREEQKTYDRYDLITEQGISQLTYITYKLPLSNGTDLKASVTDLTIDSNTDYDPEGDYANMTIEWLYGSAGRFNIRGNAAIDTYAVDDVVKDGDSPARWAKCTGAGTITGGESGPYASFTGTATWAAYTEGEHQIGTSYYAFTVEIDFDSKVMQKGYEFVQWRLRNPVGQDIDDNATGTYVGKIAPELLYYIGDVLHTMPEVWIANYNSGDVNSIVFHDHTDTGRQFPYTASITLNFNQNLQDDSGPAEYWLFFLDPEGDGSTNIWPGQNAIVVDDDTTANIEGNISGPSVSKGFAIDTNTQGSETNYTTASGPVPVVAVAAGTDKAQYVFQTGVIDRTTTNSITLNAALERNYSNPA